jgi:FAD binding domain-containing protein/berberine-like enzyme
MQAPGQEVLSDVDAVGRRRFLSVGGGVLAGVGTLSLTRPHDALDASLTRRPVTRRMDRIYPADPRYDTMRMGFNRRWVGAPAYVQLVSSAREVIDAVQRAHDRRLRITVRSGGHCYENFSSGNYGGVIVDLSNMQGVYMDRAGRVCVEGGATMWNVYETLFKNYNLTLPGGSCYSVGAGGHIVGGGYGLLSRQFGLVVDYLTGVDVVCVDRHGRARLVRARKGDPRTERLLWAHTGGGGGNFGIVTAYYFTGLPDPPAQVRVAITSWQWKDLIDKPASFAAMLRNFGRFCQANSSPSSPYRGLFALIHANHMSAGKISMTTQVAGPAFNLLEPFLAELNRGVDPPPVTTVVSMPWLQATQWLNGSGRNQRSKYKSSYMKASFPEHQIRAIYAALTDPHYNNPQALLQIDSYGCRVNSVSPDATAVPQRSSIMKLQYQTYWAYEADDEINLRWINDFYANVYADTGGVPVSNRVTDGCFINYPDVDLPSSWPALYYKSGYPALQVVKARWDPLNVFNHAQSIVPV